MGQRGNRSKERELVSALLACSPIAPLSHSIFLYLFTAHFTLLFINLCQRQNGSWASPHKCQNLTFQIPHAETWWGVQCERRASHYHAGVRLEVRRSVGVWTHALSSLALIDMHSFRHVSRKSMWSLRSWSTVDTLANFAFSARQLGSRTSDVVKASICWTKASMRVLKSATRSRHCSNSRYFGTERC